MLLWAHWVMGSFPPCRRYGHPTWAAEPKGRNMTPDVAPSDLSIFTLFWQAHWIVKTVMIGPLACSVWVWAVAIDKTILYARTSRAMDGFEKTFWSGQS